MMKVRKRMSKWSGGGCREGRRVKVRGKNEEGYFRNIKSKSRGGEKDKRNECSRDVGMRKSIVFSAW